MGYCWVKNISPAYHTYLVPSPQVYLYLYLYFFRPLEKCSYSLPALNILKKGIVLCGTPTSYIFINPWKVMSNTCYPSGKNCITAPHTYIYLVPHERNPNINLSFLSLPPTFSPITTNLICYLISKTLININPLILIKPTQCPPSIQIIYHFLNHIILNLINIIFFNFLYFQ